MKLNSYFIGIVFFVSVSYTGTASIEGIDQRAWIEIPTEIFITKNDFTKNLHDLLSKYHRIDKGCLRLLDKRIDLLQNLQQEIICLSSKLEAEKLGNTKKLETLVRKKLWYLIRIKELYKSKNLFVVFKSIKDKADGYKPLYLVNKVLFGFNFPTYWGLFQLEMIDPCHRMLTEHYIKWKRDKIKVPFFLWLETEIIPFRALQMKVFNDQELLSHEVNVRDGKFIYSLTGKLVDLSDNTKEYIYVISLNKKLYIAEAGELLRHTALSGGKPLLGSGSLKIQNGTLIYIDVESGHYQPTPHTLIQTLKILQEKGMALKERIAVAYYFNDQKTNQFLDDFLTTYEKSLCVKDLNIESDNTIEWAKPF
jgi:hypothetical protein